MSHNEDMSKQFKTVASFLVSIRKSRGFTTRQLGSIIGVSGPYISAIENGLYKLPTELFKKLTPLLTDKERKDMLAMLTAVVEREWCTPTEAASAKVEARFKAFNDSKAIQKKKELQQRIKQLKKELAQVAGGA